MPRAILAAVLGCTLTGAAGAPVAQSTVPAVTLPESGCLPAGNGYLRARIRGALNLDLNWRNAELECGGDERPDGTAVRVIFAGPAGPRGHRLRIVFGITRAHEGRSGHELPTNLTVILEGDGRLFATRGEDHCTVDTLHQERLDAGGGAARSYRVVARGFCILPASTLNNAQRILISSFDFAGRATFGDQPPVATPGTGSRF
ncbi:MAG: hypothetical protein WAK94_00655 [Steroidobacteraceae bacterium]